MHSNALSQAEFLINNYNFNNSSIFFDIGVGEGTYSIEVCKNNQGCTGAVFDLP